MPAQKQFRLGNNQLKRYAAIAVAAFALSAAPAKLQAQDENKEKIENFDVNKASEQDKALYEAIVDVLELKYDEENAAEKAMQIMTSSSKLNKEQANKHIRLMVENLMGDEYKEIMAQAKRQADAPDQNVTSNSNNDIQNKSGLSSIERAEYNKLFYKIKIASELRGKTNGNHLIQKAAHDAQIVFMSSSREKMFERVVRGVKFRDIDDLSFVAFYPKTGDGIICAPSTSMSKIKKQIKKAGGIENFVMEAQPQKVNADKSKGKSTIPLMPVNVNIR